MRVLLDENLPHQLRGHLIGHEAVTTVFMGWAGYKNGALLKAAEEYGFDVFITGDLSIEHQQNLTGRKLAIVSLSPQNWRIIRNDVVKILAAVNRARPGSFARVECGSVSGRAGPKGPALG